MIGALIGRLLAKLRPTGAELYPLVRMEVDPASAHRFDQIAEGPLVAILGLIFVAIVGVVTAPFRLVRRAD